MSDKLYSLKYAIDAYEKGFSISDKTGLEVDHKRFFDLRYYPEEINTDMFIKPWFKIHPKIEKENLYHVIFKMKNSGQINCSIEKYRDRRDWERRVPFVQEVPTAIEFIGLLTEFPDLIERREIEINYNETMFGEE